MADIPTIPLTLSADNIEEVTKQVFEILRPDWTYENAVIQRSCEGFLNVVLLCYADSTKNKKGAIVVKTCTEKFCGPSEEWKKAVRFATKHNLGVPVLAFLENGCCMEMVDGEGYGVENPRSFDDDFRDKVAEEMARWHCQAVLKDAKKFEIRKWTPLGVPAYGVWDQILGYKALVPHRTNYPNKEELVRSVEELEAEMLSTGDLTEAFCHYDFNGANIFLKVDNENGITVIDLDFIGLGYSQFDIAWFFRMMREISQPRSDPGREYEFKFLKHYLENRNKLDQKPAPSVQEVEQLYRQMQKAKVMVHIRVIASSAFVMFYNGDKPGPEAVQDGGMEMFIPRAMEYWKEYQEYKDKVFKQFA